MNPEFQMGSSPAGSPFWSEDLAKNPPDCNVFLMVIARLQCVARMLWLTFVRSSWQTNYVETEFCGRIHWTSRKSLSFASSLFLWQKTQKALHFPGWLSWFHRPAGPASERKLNAHNNHIWSSGGLRWDHKWPPETSTEVVGNMSLRGVESFRTAVDNRSDRARRSLEPSLGFTASSNQDYNLTSPISN